MLDIRTGIPASSSQIQKKYADSVETASNIVVCEIQSMVFRVNQLTGKDAASDRLIRRQRQYETGEEGM
jgi:hypothetical protein